MNDFDFQIDGEVAIVNNGSNAFKALTDFKVVDKVLNFYDKIKNDKSIKVLLIMNESGGYSVKAYEQFFKDMAEDHRKDELVKAIEVNMLRRFILKLINLNKIVIFSLSGEIVTPFFGMSLAGNFRFVCNHMKYVVNHMHYGQHPTGALPFFLPLYANQAMVSDLMYRGGEINAKDALQLGMVNKIFDSSEFHEKCIAEAKKIAEIDYDVLMKTKRLSQYIVKDLEDYFRIEMSMIEA